MKTVMKREPLSPTFFIVAILLFAAKLWLVSAHYFIGTYSPHDDLLFARQAMNIASGSWLGEYNQLTLIKGPFYPLFVAISYWLAIPVMSAQQILWFCSSLVVVIALYPAIRNQKIALLIFLFFLMNPFTYFYEGTARLFRLGIYPTLGLLTLGCYCGLVIRERSFLWRKMVWAGGAGLAFAAFWHTREESIWLVPSLGLLFLYHLYRSLRQENRGRSIKELAAVYLIPVCLFSLVTLGLRYQNYRHYGLFMTIEVESPQFKAAYGGLLRIKTDKWRRFFPVVKDVREKAYRVSPTFRELKPYLEGKLGQGWIQMAGRGYNDLPAGFFIWAFRDSVAKAGYYGSGPEAMAFYSRMGEEIDAACDDGRLDCYERVTNLVPRWHEEYNELFFPILWKTLKRIVRFNECSADTENIYSKGSAQIMELFRTITREKLRTSKPRQWKQMVPKYHLHLDREKIRILNDMGKLYSRIVPVMFLLGLGVLFCSLFFSLSRRHMPSWATLFSISSLGGVLAIAVILTLVEITSYASITRAMQASYPMVLFFILSSWYEGVNLWREKGGRRNDPESWQ